MRQSSSPCAAISMYHLPSACATVNSRPPFPTGDPPTPRRQSNGATGAAVQAQVKRQILLAVQKLTDRDTLENGVEEINGLAKGLPAAHHGVLLSTLGQGLNNTHYSKMAFTRRQVVQLLGELAISFAAELHRRSLVRLLETIVAQLEDPDSSVREACAEAIADMASTFTCQEAADMAMSADAAARRPAAGKDGSVLPIFLQPVLDNLSSHSRGKQAQMGAGLCLARLLLRIGKDQVMPALPRLCHRLGQHVESSICLARKEILWVIANLTEVCRDDMFPHIPLPAILKCLSDKDFDTRCAAADTLATFARRLPAPMASVAANVISELNKHRFDAIRPVREAIAEAVTAFGFSAELAQLNEDPPDVSPEEGSPSSSQSQTDALPSPQQGTELRRSLLVGSAQRRRSPTPRKPSGSDAPSAEPLRSWPAPDRAALSTSNEAAEAGQMLHNYAEARAAAATAATADSPVSTKKAGAHKPPRTPVFGRAPNMAFFAAQDRDIATEAALAEAQRKFEMEPPKVAAVEVLAVPVEPPRQRSPSEMSGSPLSGVEDDHRASVEAEAGLGSGSSSMRGGLRLSSLRKRAVELGVDPAKVDDAMDSDDPRSAVGELVWQAEEEAEAAHSSGDAEASMRAEALLHEAAVDAAEAAEAAAEPPAVRDRDEMEGHVVGPDGSDAMLHLSPPPDADRSSLLSPGGSMIFDQDAFATSFTATRAGTELDFGVGPDDSGWLEAAEAAVAAGLNGQQLTAAVTAGVVSVRPARAWPAGERPSTTAAEVASTASPVAVREPRPDPFASPAAPPPVPAAATSIHRPAHLRPASSPAPPRLHLHAADDHSPDLPPPLGGSRPSPPPLDVEPNDSSWQEDLTSPTLHDTRPPDGVDDAEFEDDPGKQPMQINASEWQSMTRQLRQLSEQQTKLVELMDSFYGKLDFRLAAVESSVKQIQTVIVQQRLQDSDAGLGDESRIEALMDDLFAPFGSPQLKHRRETDAAEPSGV